MNKQKNLSRSQWTMIAAVVCVYWISYDICRKYFHLDHSDLTMVLFMVPFMTPIAYTSRNLQRKSATEDFKDLIAIVISFLLTGWIPFIILASLVQFDLEKIRNYPEPLLFAVILTVVVSYALIIIKILKMLGYCLTPRELKNTR